MPSPNASEALIHGHCPACGTIQPVRGNLVEPHDRDEQWVGWRPESTRCIGSGMAPRSHIVLPERLAPAFVPGGGRRF